MLDEKILSQFETWLNKVPLVYFTETEFKSEWILFTEKQRPYLECFEQVQFMGSLCKIVVKRKIKKKALGGIVKP